MKILGICFFLLCLFQAPVLALDAEQMLDEANDSFTYLGEPIHPFLIREFSSWLSDRRPPMITSVDIRAAFDTNKYQQSTVEKRGNLWFSESRENDGDITLYESFAYQWLGKMENDYHVLEAGAGGGGSGVFLDLIIVKFSLGEIDWEGQKEQQLLLSVVGTYSLGDRYEGDIRVHPDKIVIPPSKDRSIDEPVREELVLQF